MLFCQCIVLRRPHEVALRTAVGISQYAGAEAIVRFHLLARREKGSNAPSDFRQEGGD